MMVQHSDNGKKGAFFIERKHKRLAEMAYSWAGTDQFIIDHTDVREALRGQGAGRRLLDAAVQFARSRQVKIIPLCPFAKSVFAKDASIRDVLA